MKTITLNNTLTIFLNGRIDTNNAAETERQIFDAIEGRTENIIIDAEKLEYISSAGLRVLMKLKKRIANALPMINVSHDVYDILDTTGFTELLEDRINRYNSIIEGFCLLKAALIPAIWVNMPEEHKKAAVESARNYLFPQMEKLLEGLNELGLA